RRRFEALHEGQGKPRPLFATAAADLFDVYLDALPAELRQENACATCKRFFERFAGLVTIDAKGQTSPVFWAAKQAPQPYVDAVAALAAAVSQAPVVGLFLSSEPNWGPISKGGWTHLAVTPPSDRMFTVTGLRRPGPAAAEVREDFRTLVAAL